MASSDIHVYYQNSRGLRTKTMDFFHNVISSDFDIIGITESWLNASIASAEPFF